ncbi:uncharacterized protein LOC130947796 [Arachis stenosperma]|uniref:uncharacterized protein LOC130947796 n=1 Tax=Arachis stenosperma TaxID=217475 RepID=UPI0025ABC263|nr:uncharacterized protein LOC130947796 [Arachis stenosperma]
MKASLKFREEQKPLLRAKVPLNILGMPFQSGIVAGDSKELTLNLGTFFDSGPSIRLSYRPNDSLNPFSLVVKTGTGPFGSPLSSSMLMSCEFNLLPNRLTGNRNNVTSPLFMLHFKPRFGDFSFKKSQSSIFDKKGFAGGVVVGGGGAGSDDDGSIEVVDSPAKVAAEIGGFGGYGGGKVPILGGGSQAAGAIAGMFSGMEVSARTTLPVRGRAALKFRWGVRVPAEMKVGEGKTTSGFAFRNVPFLVMDKIGIEHMVDGGGGRGGNLRDVKGKGNGELSFPTSGDVAEACLTVKRQLEVLQAENGLLRNAVEDLRREIAGTGGGGFEFGRNGMKGKNTDPRKSEKKSSDFNGFPGKSNEADASAELKKAFIGATSP